MNNRLKRRYLIRKLFKEVAKETVGAKNLKKLKLIILNTKRKASYCKYRHRFVWHNNRRGQEIHIIIGLNLANLERTIKEGYTPCYYINRPLRLNKYVIKNRHNALRFVLYHEARHAWQRINDKYRDSIKDKEFDADTWALAHLKTRPDRQTRKPDQTKTETVLTRPIKWETAEYIELYKAGYSTAKIAVLCKVKDPRSVRYYLTKAGISLRRRAE